MCARGGFLWRIQMDKSVNALITIKSDQMVEGSPDSVEMLVGGIFTVTDSGYRINYDETDPENGSKTATEVTFDNETRVVTVKRSGEISTHMVFEQGKRHLVYYDTVYGSLLVGISTHRLSAGLTPDGGTLAVEYAIEIDSEVVNEIRLEIDVSPSV